MNFTSFQKCVFLTEGQRGTSKTSNLHTSCLCKGLPGFLSSQGRNNLFLTCQAISARASRINPNLHKSRFKELLFRDTKHRLINTWINYELPARKGSSEKKNFLCAYYLGKSPCSECRTDTNNSSNSYMLRGKVFFIQSKRTMFGNTSYTQHRAK